MRADFPITVLSRRIILRPSPQTNAMDSSSHIPPSSATNSLVAYLRKLRHSTNERSYAEKSNNLIEKLLGIADGLLGALSFFTGGIGRKSRYQSDVNNADGPLTIPW